MSQLPISAEYMERFNFPTQQTPPFMPSLPSGVNPAVAVDAEAAAILTASLLLGDSFAARLKRFISSGAEAIANTPEMKSLILQAIKERGGGRMLREYKSAAGFSRPVYDRMVVDYIHEISAAVALARNPPVITGPYNIPVPEKMREDSGMTPRNVAISTKQLQSEKWAWDHLTPAQQDLLRKGEKPYTPMAFLGIKSIAQLGRTAKNGPIPKLGTYYHNKRGLYLEYAVKPAMRPVNTSTPPIMPRIGMRPPSAGGGGSAGRAQPSYKEAHDARKAREAAAIGADKITYSIIPATTTGTPPAISKLILPALALLAYIV